MFHFAHPQSALRDAITSAYRCDEAEAVRELLEQAQFSSAEKIAIHEMARKLVEKVRKTRRKASGVDALMLEFSLSSEEGIALMCLAEALLRIPDKTTRQSLIRDKIAGGDWHSHLHNSPSLFVNAAAWGLLLTGKLSAVSDDKNLSSTLSRLLKKGGAPLINKGVDYAMRLLGKQFVTGQTISEALENGKEREKMGYRFSFDMLGEAAMTHADAERYFQDYVQAIHAIGQDAAGAGVYEGNGISVKLSAIHPRYQRAQRGRVLNELLPRLKELFLLAKQYDIGLNIDAEEAERLELSLDLMEAIVSDPDLAGFQGIGFVVQAYQKRAPFVIDYLIELARRHKQRIMVRLVKGAYWDSEIKWAQVNGLDGYPVYTRKVHTDVSYLACARKLFSAQDAIFPQFATHNAYTMAAVVEMGKEKEFEHQCLHGMGETLYDQVLSDKDYPRHCRVYAPVGTHETLLAYLVRRLLENGANTSFVNQIVNKDISIETLIRCPLKEAEKGAGKMHIALPLPRDLYGQNRQNAKGIDLSNELTLQRLENNMSAATKDAWTATSLLAVPDLPAQAAQPVLNPADHHDRVGTVAFLDPESVPAVVAAAKTAEGEWATATTSPSNRAAFLRKFADLLEKNSAVFMMLAVREAGKTVSNAIAEVREAVDFCRYYANEAETTCATRTPLGTVVAISPWNFPLAIFVGEVVAALAVGNVVIAKPAEQTSLIAHFAVQLLHQAGIPRAALQLVLGAGDVGAALVQDERINGVIFTGSTEVAKSINKTLAARDDAPVLIAETGGQNAMIVDSSALLEQVCADVVQSAFDSAGQRCSALRILCVQEEIADPLLKMIKGAMNELTVGNPQRLSSDIGPVIDAEVQQNLKNHIEKMRAVAKSCHQIPVAAEDDERGTFIAPVLFELPDLNELQREVFGPVLHVVRYRCDELDVLIAALNAKGYALTHGIHSRINERIEHISTTIEAGNIYVNRNIVGAVVGVQPFGGHGLSGTGPKAGGAFYLQRLSRGEGWQMPTLTTRGRADDSALAELETWLDTLPLQHAERVKLAEAMGKTRVHTLRHAETELTGPTGERNILRWKMPAWVWIQGGALLPTLMALIPIVAAGGKVALPETHRLAEFGAEKYRWLSFSGNMPDGCAHAVSLDPLSSKDKQALSKRAGAIVKTFDASKGLDILPLFDEISLSINTSAAGGNATLMAMADS